MMRQTINWMEVELEGRQWRLLTTELGLCRIIMPSESLDSWNEWMSRIAPGVRPIEDCTAIKRTGIVDWLHDYFAGKSIAFTDEIPLDLIGTPFQQQVWTALGQVPYGETRTYGEIAASIDRPQAVRAVGAANGANPIPVLLPCHRIIGADRKLTGFRGGLDLKRRLLDIEQINGVKDGGHARFLF